MEKLFLVLVLCVVVKGAHKHHPKFLRGSGDLQQHFSKRVACTDASDEERNKITEQAQCGEPKDVFVYLRNQASYEEIRPAAVWVKRCVGLCYYGADGSQCVPTKVATREIPIRVFNLRTNKESCSTHTVEEHLECGCCTPGPHDCPAHRVFNPQEQEYEVEPI